MKPIRLRGRTVKITLLLLLTSGWCHAGITDLANAPLATSSTSSVLPNLMFTLDDSGSMGWDYLPDHVGNKSDKAFYYSSDYNRVYYNPQITYSPGVDPDPVLVGASISRGSQGNPWTAVKVNSYSGSATINLTNNYNPYPSNFNNPAGNPFYYSIAPKEYCNSSSLINCVLSTTPTGSYIYPAPVRHCKTSTQANSASAQTGPNKCQLKYDAGNYTNVRVGTLTRTDIVPGTASYTGRPNRTDCTSGTCTYDQEMTNFANWYTYYRTRMQMMKTAAGQAFISIDDKYRVGFITINPGNPVSSNKYLAINKFDIAQKTAWYSKLYSQSPNGGTPLREALSRVGRHFAGKTSGINSGMTPDPVQYSCQQNFNILTTDGYWNKSGPEGVDLSGGSIGNQDNVDSGYTTRSIGAYDPNPVPTGDLNSLADVAAYYYKTDLRPTGSNGVLGTDVSEDNVPHSASDPNTAQHMVTFALGLVDGKMTYRPDYDSAAEGDFYAIKTGSTGCSWQSSGVCNWPMPVGDTDTALDDLWHAAVNGHGRFYSASDPTTLSTGLEGALAGVSAKTGAAAAAATSSPNVTQSDSSIFSTTYRTAKWDGEVMAQQIDIGTGNVMPAIVWSAQALLDAKVSASTDSRTIYTFDPSAANKLKDFQWPSLTIAEQAYFNNRGSVLDQYGSLTTAQRTIADNGQNLLEYLRGRRQMESLAIYRARDHVLGDTVTATPAYVSTPQYQFSDSGYSAFKSSKSIRQPMLYIASNDGMLHALNASNGQEMWAYVPRIIFPKLAKLANDGYPTKHEYFVDGSPATMDVYIGGAWKTILVGGFNGGGRGYYALDVTDPASPAALWEICSDSTLCSISDIDLGYSFGNPVITKNGAGNWIVIVSSGHNNISPGDGEGHFFILNAETGAILQKFDTSSGNTAAPSGLSKISAWADNANVDNTALRVYGGDLNGDIWRLDLTGTISGSNPMKLAMLRDANGNSQPVTTKLELGVCGYTKMIFAGTGRYLGVSDLSNVAQQSIYGFRDDLSSTGLGDLQASGQMVRQTITQPSAITRTVTNNPVNLLSDKGWFTDLLTTGERVNIDPQLVLGTLLFSGNIPNANACNAGGDSWQYQFDYCSGSYVSSSSGQAVAVKMANEMTAGFVVVSLPSGALKQIVTGTSGTKTTFGVNVGGSAGTAKRVSWREIF